MPRFAVLDHDWPHPHRDLFLERDGVLLAWRLPPAFDLSCPIPAAAIGPHRPAYLDYEGSVSGDRGHVRRWDGGELAWESHSDSDIRVRLEGTHLRGRFRLAQKDESEWVMWAEESSPPRAHEGT